MNLRKNLDTTVNQMPKQCQDLDFVITVIKLQKKMTDIVYLPFLPLVTHFLLHRLQAGFWLLLLFYICQALCLHLLNRNLSFP